MDSIEKILPITQVKKELLDVIKEMTEGESTITETIEILVDPVIIKALKASERDFRTGKAIPTGMPGRINGRQI